MRSSPRRPLILRRRRLNLPTQDGVQGARASGQGPPAIDPRRQNVVLDKSATPEQSLMKPATPEQSPAAGAGTAATSGLSGVKVMGHPTIPDTQLVVLPPDSDVESIIQALTVRGKESGCPNKFILITGSGDFHTQVAKLGLRSKAEVETVQLEAVAAPPHQTGKCSTGLNKGLHFRVSACCQRMETFTVLSTDPSEGPELDGSLTNIQWLGEISSEGLGPCDLKAESAEEENGGTEAIKVEEEQRAPPAAPSWQVGPSERPPYSYMALIQFAINSTTSKRMTLKDIYTWIEDHFPYFKHVAKPGWKNSIRHNLSLHDMFVRESPNNNNKVSYWTIHPQANRCLTLDQVFKVGVSKAQSCTHYSAAVTPKIPIPELSKMAPLIPSNAKAPERKMKPLLPRIDSYLIPVQFPIAQPLILSPLETFSLDPGLWDGPRSCKRVRMAPKVLLEMEEPPPAEPVKTEPSLARLQPPVGCPRVNGSRRKQQLVTPRSQEPELLLLPPPDSSCTDSGLDTDFSFLPEGPSQLTQDEGSSFKTPVKEKFMKPPASSTPSTPVGGAPCVQPWGAESPLTRDPLSDFSPVRIPRGSAALTPFKDSYGTLSFWETPFKDLPYFGSPPDLPPFSSPGSPQQPETLDTASGARRHRGCSKELQVGGSTNTSNRSLLEGLVLDTKDESLSKILLDISFSGLEEEEDGGVGDGSYWGQLLSELR
ncbi:G2/M transition of mitotic cell cycle [Pristimantis euphronides]